MSKLKVNMISETVFTVQAHGVHTAFIENYNCLKARDDVDIKINSGRRADIIHLQTVGPYSLWKLLTAKGCTVFSAHLTPETMAGSLIGIEFWRPLAKVYLKFLYNRCDGVIAVSEEVKRELTELGIRPDKIYVVLNTLDTEPYRRARKDRRGARQRLGYKPDDFVVVGVGQVQPRKRVDTYFDAATKMPELEFAWVGGIPFGKLGYDSGKMEELMKHPPKNMRFTGIIEQTAKLDYYAAADLFFFPSMQENFGLVVVEAAAAGLPVLLRDIPVYKPIFSPGYLAGEDDNFVETIKRLHTDQEFYDEWARKAAIIADRYDSKVGAEKLLETYADVMEHCKHG